MDDRTFTYLTGRFRDYYRGAAIDLPPEIEYREWGYIPWNQERTVMVRHNSLLEIGTVEEFLPEECPRHLYTSAAKYEEPGAPTMEEKRWMNSDLVFDIDIDENHLPSYIEKPAEDISYDEMLALAKEHLLRLLVVLEDEFGYEDIEIVFSGGRGYHVHVRDERVQDLTGPHRSALVAYIQGVNLDLDSLTQEASTSIGTPLGKGGLAFKPSGGWSTRVHERLVDVMDRYLAMCDDLHEDEARDQLAEEFDGIGTKTAKTIIGGFINHEHAIRAGHLNPVPGLKDLTQSILRDIKQDTRADIDEPVTNDVNRLIRLPGSLHGKTGLQVTRIPREDIETFDPLVDAVPETFRGQEIAIRVDDGPVSVPMLGETFEFETGEHRVPEMVGLYLMAQGLAEKETE